MKILMIAPEIFPLAKTGGLADVVGSLSRVLAQLGQNVALVMPAYKTSLERDGNIEETGISLEVSLGKKKTVGTVINTNLAANLPVYLIRADDYFFRDHLYGTSRGEYPDNAERFAFFSKAALELANRTGPWDILHGHDWQTALMAVLKKTHPQRWPALESAKFLLTIHNLAYQGNFPASEWPLLNLPRKYFVPNYLEFYGSFNLLKGGILFADALTTVSRRYASEIKTPEFGCGLHGVVIQRERDLFGILNGVDYEEWSPESDPHIVQKYSRENLQGKSACKQQLQQLYGLPADSTVPVIGMVSRLVEQKGIDVLMGISEELLTLDLQMVILGTGDHKHETALAGLASRYPKKLGLQIGFDNPVAHRIEAGADMFLMPSRFEPCGLNQIYSLRYGTIPIVRATGGLDDTVEDYNPLRGTGNGIKFAAYSGPVLLEAIKRALALYSYEKHWQKLIANAMASDFSWDRSASEYLGLYQKLVHTA